MTIGLKKPLWGAPFRELRPNQMVRGSHLNGPPGFMLSGEASRLQVAFPSYHQFHGAFGSLPSSF